MLHDTARFLSQASGLSVVLESLQPVIQGELGTGQGRYCYNAYTHPCFPTAWKAQLEKYFPSHFLYFFPLSNVHPYKRSLFIYKLINLPK